MTVKELKDLLQPLPDNVTVKMLSSSYDKINDNCDISNVVLVEPLTYSDNYNHELVFAPE